VIGSGSAQATLKLIHPGTLTVCSEASYPPFENTVDGKMVGFDIDIAQGVADQIGKGTTVTSVATEFNSIESGAALDTGACDLLASALSITPAREAKFDFSDPYYQADTGILVMDPSLTSAAALKGKKVACQIGTTGMTWAKDQGLDVVEFANLGMQVQSMKQGDVQAVINDSEVLTPFVGQDSMRIGFTVTGDKFGLGIAKGNDALREVANQAIAQMRADGRYDQLIKKWFVDASASPTAGDTAENGSAAPVSSPSN
jgi:polar amino acid transport system substrate-binding protein